MTEADTFDIFIRYFDSRNLQTEMKWLKTLRDKNDKRRRFCELIAFAGDIPPTLRQQARDLARQD